MLRRFSRIDPETITFLNILHLLDIYSSMTFWELWDKGLFTSQKYLGKDLRKLTDAGFVVQKLDIYYITKNGSEFLSFFPNWKPKRRKRQQTKPVIF